MYRELKNGDIVTKDKIIFKKNVDKLTNHIYKEKYLENSHPFENTKKGAKIWAIQLLIKKHKFQWVSEAIK